MAVNVIDMIQASRREYLPWSQDTYPRFSLLQLCDKVYKKKLNQLFIRRTTGDRRRIVDLSTLHLIVCVYTIIRCYISHGWSITRCPCPFTGFSTEAWVHLFRPKIIVDFPYEKPLLTQVINDIFRRHAKFFQKHIIYVKLLREKIKFIMYDR